MSLGFFGVFFSIVNVSKKYCLIFVDKSGRRSLLCESISGISSLWWLSVSTKNVIHDEEAGVVGFKSHASMANIQSDRMSNAMQSYRCRLFSYIIPCDNLWMYLNSSGIANSIISKLNVYSMWKGETFVGWCLPRLKMYIINVSAKIKEVLLTKYNVALHD